MNRTRAVADLGEFEFECGRTIPVEVAYETYGDPGDEAVLVCHALTGSAHVTGPTRDVAASDAGSDADALSGFGGEALVVSVAGDWHFTVEQAERLAAAFEAAGADVAHRVLDSDHGHDAFLVEPGAVGPPVRDFLAAGVEGLSRSDAARRAFAPVHAGLFGDWASAR